MSEGLSAVGPLIAGVGLAYGAGSPEPLTRPREFVPPGKDAFVPAAQGAPAPPPGGRSAEGGPVS